MHRIFNFSKKMKEGAYLVLNLDHFYKQCDSLKIYILTEYNSLQIIIAATGTVKLKLHAIGIDPCYHLTQKQYVFVFHILYKVITADLKCYNYHP